MKNSTHDPLMAALSAAEQLVALSPAAPYTVQIRTHSSFPEDVIGVELYFPTTQALRVFAVTMGVGAVDDPFDFGDAVISELVAAGVLDTVPFRAWALVDLPRVTDTVPMPLVVPLANAPMAVSA